MLILLLTPPEFFVHSYEVLQDVTNFILHRWAKDISSCLRLSYFLKKLFCAQSPFSPRFTHLCLNPNIVMQSGDIWGDYVGCAVVWSYVENSSLTGNIFEKSKKMKCIFLPLIFHYIPNYQLMVTTCPIQRGSTIADDVTQGSQLSLHKELHITSQDQLVLVVPQGREVAVKITPNSVTGVSFSYTKICCLLHTNSMVVLECRILVAEHRRL